LPEVAPKFISDFQNDSPLCVISKDNTNRPRKTYQEEEILMRILIDSLFVI